LIDRRTLLLGTLALPWTAHAFLERAQLILKRAKVPKAPQKATFSVLTRDGKRADEAWTFDPFQAPLAASSFERETLQTLFTQGAAGLVERLKIDPKRRRMALVGDRPSQVIGRSHEEPSGPAIWLDHQHATLLRVAAQGQELRLLHWDVTAKLPFPRRLEYYREGAWQRVAATLEVTP
jgi:hypothetical protein